MKLLSITQLLILAAITKKPGTYGSEISRDTELSIGSLYVVIGRLEDKGYIATYEDTDYQGRGPARKRCYMTEDGKGAFDRTKEKIENALANT